MAATVGKILFLDTTVLLTATDTLGPLHEEAQRLLEEPGPRGFHLAASGQVLREYLAVPTRPAESNGLGLPDPHAVANIDRFLKFVTLIDETESVALRLRELVMTSGVRGNRLHDANIAATMMVHHIRILVTQNHDAFATIDELEALLLDRVIVNSRSSPLPRPTADHPSCYQATLGRWPSDAPVSSSRSLGASAGSSPRTRELLAEPPVNGSWDRSARSPQARKDSG